MRIGKHVVVVGAGVGGLAAAIRLIAAGAHVTLLEAAASPGGKMRTVDTPAGPADAGPTVLTMRWVFEDLFRAAGTCLSDHVTLTQNSVIARHFWSDGAVLDLMAEASESQDNIRKVFGKQAADEFTRFSSRAKRLFEAFEHPMMRAGQPSSFGLAATVLRQPSLILDLAPGQSLASVLARTFSDPKLRQLFGRYATYVGGSPYASPALLSLIWHAENSGVWSVKGGMHALALAMAQLLQSLGADIRYNSPVSDIRPTDMGVVVDTMGQSIHADAVVFNGDPRALSEGTFGAAMTRAVPATADNPRSLSADVMAFAAVPNGVDLSHHNVFFGDDPLLEFDPISKGQIPIDPTLYVCAQDRGFDPHPSGPERFEIIMNAAPCAANETPSDERASQCQTRILDRLHHMGLEFSPRPGHRALTQPSQFNQLFPHSLGSLYGRSPHGMTAGLKRPMARTAIPGLYLAGGGAHPGAGVPMATLSGQHAAEAISTDLGLTSKSPATGTRGGMSTESRIAAPALSRSSRS